MSTLMQQFHLLMADQMAEPGWSGGTHAPEGSAIAHLVVPPGPSCLTARPGGLELVLEQDGDDASLILEPLTIGNQPQLLLIAPPEAELRINGQPAARVSLLGERDFIQLNDAVGLHVTLYRRPCVGPPSEEHRTQPCPVCLGNFKPDTTVYVCWNCYTAVHCEGEEKKESERLECIRLSNTCPSCQAAVVFTEGYTWLPQAEMSDA